MEISKKAKWMGSASVVLAARRHGWPGRDRVRSDGLPPTTFNRNFSTMSLLKSVTAKGTGGIGAILPDTVSSTRYVEFDAPYLNEAMKDAGPAVVWHLRRQRPGQRCHRVLDAQADITKGDKVLIMDPLDSGMGAKIESYAAAHGVKVIDYDRLTLGGSRAYYDSFNNTYVGTLLGKGLVSCIASEHVAKPVVLVMHGAVTDNNATLFANGYDAVLSPYFSSHKWTLVGKLQPNRSRRDLDAQRRAHRVPAGVHRPPGDQRRAHAQRRERRPDHHLLEVQGHPGQDPSGHRPGRHPDGARQHPHWLPVRYRLQADLPRGSGRRGARCLPACR